MRGEQTSLRTFAVDTGPDTDVLTDAEREAYTACERGDTGVRDYARRTDRSPGTIGNLLARARGKLQRGEQ